MTQPIDNLRRLEAALDADCTLPEDLVAWLLDGIVAYRQQGGRMSLCRCLGLRAPGKRLLGTRVEYGRRNAALQMAAACIADTDVTPWKRAEWLAYAIMHHKSAGRHALARLPYGVERWRRECVAKHLRQAFETGLTVPESAQGIYNLLRAKKSTK